MILFPNYVRDAVPFQTSGGSTTRSATKQSLLAVHSVSLPSK